MAVYEQTTLLRCKDENGNEYLLYPITRLDCVDGAEDLVHYDKDQELTAVQKAQFLKNIGGLCAPVSAQANQFLKVSAVDANGNVTAVETAEVDGGVGEETQSDWNVTDETDPAYIKNKPNVATQEYVDDAVSNVTVEVDADLSQEGKAADAKAVGEALSLKQPVGNYVKSINGNTPDKNGNVTIEVGSGSSGAQGVSVQSDWNVADETDPAYIKNRPFGETPNVWVPLVPTTEFGPFYLNSGFGVYVYERPATCEFVIGETYRVTWHENIYECVAQDVSVILPGGIALGNGAAFGLSGNNEPFIVYIVNNYEGYISLTDTAPGATHTVGIEEIGTVIHKIDPKYLHASDWNVADKNEAGYIANRPFGTVPSGTVIVEETTFSFAANTLHLFPLPDIGPYDYKVEFDGVEYFASGELREIDNVPQYGFTVTSSEGVGLFTVIKNFEGREGIDIIGATEGAHTFKITLANDAIYKIDPKYLPNNIGGGSSGSALPDVTTADAGKFLRVTDEGLWAAVSIPNAEGVGF